MKPTIVRSRRKTLSLEIRPDASVLVRAPMRMSNQEIQDFLRKKASWVDTQLARMRSRPVLPPWTEEELRHFADLALQYIPSRVAHFAPLVGVSYGRITIRSQLSRWGSCSSKGNLNFNCLLTQCPPEVLDYVVVHELCHRLEMNHSPRFWGEVARILPDYAVQRAWLRTQGGGLIDRLRGGRASRNEVDS